MFVFVSSRAVRRSICIVPGRAGVDLESIFEVPGGSVALPEASHDSPGVERVGTVVRGARRAVQGSLRFFKVRCFLKSRFYGQRGRRVTFNHDRLEVSGWLVCRVCFYVW